MQGNLAQISLNDILLLATGGKKSGVLKLSRGKETVEVYISDGNIIHATCPIGEGEKALLYPVTWGEGVEPGVGNHIGGHPLGQGCFSDCRSWRGAKWTHHRALCWVASAQ